jgi:hypothetical protein
MSPHRVDPLSAVLGVISVAIGLIVATGSVDRLTRGGGGWLALTVLAMGLVVVGSAVRQLTGSDTETP